MSSCEQTPDPWRIPATRCIKCGAPCRDGRFRCDQCQAITDAQRGQPLPPAQMITERFHSERKTTSVLADCPCCAAHIRGGKCHCCASRTTVR